MTFNETKQKLERLSQIDKNIESMLFDLERLKSRYVKAIDYTDIHIASSKSHSGIEMIIEMLDKKEERLMKLMFEKEVLVEWFENSIKNLDNDEQAILRDRYVNNMSISKLINKYFYADKTGISRKISRIIAKMTTNDN